MIGRHMDDDGDDDAEKEINQFNSGFALNFFFCPDLIWGRSFMLQDDHTTRQSPNKGVIKSEKKKEKKKKT